MTEMPPPPVPVPPSIASPLPPGTPAGRPRIWQAIVLLLAFGGLAGGSCAAFLNRPSGGSADLWTIVFVLTIPFAAGAFALLVFRLWRRRIPESWPSLGQSALLLAAGTGLAIGGCGGFGAMMQFEEIWPVAMALGAAFVAGAALAFGAVELFFIALARLILSPRR